MRFIKDSIWTSPNLNSLSDMAERHFYRLLPLPDDHGCCELTSAVVKGRCYPLKDKVSVKMITEWTEELREADIIRTWEDKGRLFAYFPTWAEHQRIRSLNKRKTPEPPSLVVNCRQETSVVADCGSILSSLSSLPSSPVLSPLLRKRKGGELVFPEGFEKFWTAYPKKKSKGDAEMAWNKINPNEQLLARMLATIEQAKTSVDWTKDGGQWVPFPATWLNGKRWEDEFTHGENNGKPDKYAHIGE